MNSVETLKQSQKPKKKLSIVRLGNNIYLYNSTLFKIIPQGEDRRDSVKIQEISSSTESPISDYYLYSSEGNFLLITEFLNEKTGLESPKYIINGTKYWLFNINTQVWIHYDIKSFIPHQMNNTCAILKYPYIIILGSIGQRSENIFVDFKYRINIFNLVTKSIHSFDLKNYSGDLSFTCQTLRTYKNTSNTIPSDIIEIIVTVKDLNDVDKFYKIEKITASENGIIQSNFIESLSDVKSSSYNYFLIDIDEIYFFYYKPIKVTSENTWWEYTSSMFTKGEGRAVHNAFVATNDSSIEVLNNTLFVISGTTNDRVTGISIDSGYYYESNILKASFIRSCDYGYSMVSGACQPCPNGTYNNNKAAGECVPCNTFLESTSEIGAWSSSQCTNLLNYASETEEIFFGQALGVNSTELLIEYDQLQDSYLRFPLIIILALIFSLLIIKPLQLALVKLDYFRFNKTKTAKRNSKIERLTKKLSFYNEEQNNDEAWVTHKRTNISEKIIYIKEKIEKKVEEKHPRFRGLVTGLVLVLTMFFFTALYISLYYSEELIKNETLSISEYENEYQKLGSIVKIHLGFFPVNHNLCDILLNLRPEIFDKDPKYLETVEIDSNYSETENGGTCIINLSVNLTDSSEKFRAKLELISRKIYAKNLFVYVQSYNSELNYPLSVFKTFQSSEGQSFANNIKVELNLKQKTFVEDYFFTSNKLTFNSIDKDLINISPDLISDDYLPLGSLLIFDFSIVWSKTAEVKTMILMSSPDLKIILLLFVIVLIHEGLWYCGSRVIQWYEKWEELKKNKDLSEPFLKAA